MQCPDRRLPLAVVRFGVQSSPRTRIKRTTPLRPVPARTTGPRPARPAGLPRWHPRRRTVHGLGRPPRFPAVGPAIRPSSMTPGRAACRRVGGFRRLRERSRSGSPCGSHTRRRQPPEERVLPAREVTSRRTELRLTDAPTMPARRAPARPARARPIAARVERSRSVRWPCLRVRPGICSTNVRRGHSAVRQAKRRTRSWSTTLRPAESSVGTHSARITQAEPEPEIGRHSKRRRNRTAHSFGQRRPRPSPPAERVPAPAPWPDATEPKTTWNHAMRRTRSAFLGQMRGPRNRPPLASTI
jgi:hypothetical protein